VHYGETAGQKLLSPFILEGCVVCAAERRSERTFPLDGLATAEQYFIIFHCLFVPAALEPMYVYWKIE
jgi:hypothetical protein